MKFWCAIFLVVSGLLADGLAGSYPIDTARQEAQILPSGSPSPLNEVTVSENDALQLKTAFLNLEAIQSELQVLGQERIAFQMSRVDSKRKPLTSEESDQIENLLYRYLSCREIVWEMIAYYGNSQVNFTGEEAQTKAFAISYGAAVMLGSHSARWVEAFVDDGRMIHKLNEIHNRYDIPEGAYDRLFDGVTARENIGVLRDTHKYFQAEVQDPESALSKIMARDEICAKWVRDSEVEYQVFEKTLAAILKARSLVLPDTANLIRQNRLVELARQTTRQISEGLYVAQGILFSRVSDIKGPQTPPADFTPEQVAQIKALLEPGDLILTFTAGYMSNAFLPGKFKHGITYVGTPAQRRALGLATDEGAQLPESKVKQLEKNLQCEKLENGYPADVIEAVSEGVIFNSLDYLLKHHINRVAVLRPRVPPTDRQAALLHTFLLLGGRYDFNFDFSDASFLCCTEVMYRSWNRRGGIDFKLIRRAAVLTLSADDILSQHFAQSDSPFELILFAEEDQKTKWHSARLFTGPDATVRLRELMAETPFQFPNVGFAHNPKITERSRFR